PIGCSPSTPLASNCYEKYWMMFQLTIILKTSFTSGFEGIPVGERGTDVSPLTINNLMLISTFCFVPTVSRFIIMVRPVCDYQGKKGGYLNWYASLPTRVQGYTAKLLVTRLI